MNKQNIIISIVVILIIIFLVYFTRGKQEDGSVNQAPTVQYSETTTVGSVPDVNPAGRVNPLKGVKTNPFE